MSQFTKDEKKSYIGILADGKFHEEVDKDTDDAVLREYETSDGKKGAKYELVYTKIFAKITGIEFQDGEYGTNIQLSLSGEERDVVVSVGVSSSFGEDLMKKLPQINLQEPVDIAPYSFIDENGKSKKGITVYQNNEKLNSYFSKQKEIDGKKKWVAINGYPTPEGDIEDYKSDDWKLFYLQARKFLIKYTKENIIPKLNGEVTDTETLNEDESADEIMENISKTPLNTEPPQFLKRKPVAEEGEVSDDEIPF